MLCSSGLGAGSIDEREGGRAVSMTRASRRLGTCTVRFSVHGLVKWLSRLFAKASSVKFPNRRIFRRTIPRLAVENGSFIRVTSDLFDSPLDAARARDVVLAEPDHGLDHGIDVARR